MTQKWHEIRSDSTKTAVQTTPQMQSTELKKDGDKQ